MTDGGHPSDRAGVVETVDATAHTIPTDHPEADGTIAWTTTTIIVVQCRSGDQVGTGWTYGSAAIAPLVEETLAPVVVGHGVLETGTAWQRMARALRNVGRPGVGGMALSAVDNALWDLKARALGLPLHRLLGSGIRAVPVYGSGGFTTYDADRLHDQLRGWVDQGVAAVKIKIGESWGTKEERDLARVREALDTIGPGVELFVDANGGYPIGQAVRVGHALDDLGVRWFEEPVSSDDLAGLRDVRQATRLDVAAGEYIATLDDARRMCDAGAVDCLQVDVTRCGGTTELLRIAAVAAAHHLEVSGHCAPYQHAPTMAAVPNLRHLEYFHDHSRIERAVFHGADEVVDGHLRLSERPGNGLTFDPRRAAELAVPQPA